MPAPTPAWIHLFLDVSAHDLDSAVDFWSSVTGWTASARRGEDDQFLTLLPDEGPAWVKMQAVDGPARVHLDLDTMDRRAAVDVASGLGATTAWRYHDVEVMRSPGGFTFCQTLLDSPAPIMERTGRTILDQVCIDIPASHWDTEVAFWRDLTGRPLQHRDPASEFAVLEDPGRLRILLQRLDDHDGDVRAHPDLATADRSAETDRHIGLGARLKAAFDEWTVLTAPGGQVYCLTDRDPLTGRVRRRAR